LQELSQSSVLFIHRVIYAGRLVEVYFGNIQLQVKLDWIFIVDSLGIPLLESFGACTSIAGQLTSTAEVVNLLTLKLMTSTQ